METGLVKIMQYVGEMPALAIRSAIQELQRYMDMDLEVTHDPSCCFLRHHFAPGTYAREMHMHAGMVILGKIHRHSHLNIISKGRVQVLTEHEGFVEYTAPCTFVSHSSTQRVVHVLEDAVWTTMHPTESTDLAEIEADIIANSYTELDIIQEVA